MRSDFRPAALAFGTLQSSCDHVAEGPTHPGNDNTVQYGNSHADFDGYL